MPNETVGGCKTCKHHEEHTHDIVELQGKFGNIKIGFTVAVGIFAIAGILLMFILTGQATTDRELRAESLHADNMLRDNIRDHEACMTRNMNETLKAVEGMRHEVEKVKATNKVILIYLKEIMEHSSIPVPLAIPEDK